MIISRMLIAAAIVHVAALAAASDWPQYKRDAARSGDAAEETLSFPLNRVVAVRFPSPIYASPAVVGGVVYVQDSRGNLAAVDAKANKVLWLTEIGGVNNRSSPAVMGGKVYVGSTAGYLAILDAGTGKILQKVPGEGGVFLSPLCVEGAVYFAPWNGQVVKIDPEGRVIWTFAGGRDCIAEFSLRDNEVLIWIGDPERLAPHRKGEIGQLHGLTDAGATVKSRVVAAPKGSTWPVLPLDGAYEALKVPGKTWKEWGRYNYRLWDAAEEIVTHSFRGDRRYFRLIDMLLCVAAPDTGAWMAGAWPAYDGPSGYVSKPALAKEHLVLGGDDGRVYFYTLEAAEKTAPDRDRKPCWVYQTSRAGKPNGAVSSSPAISGGTVFFGGEDGVLYGLGRGSPAELGEAKKEPPRKPEDRPGRKLKGAEWATVGYDMSYCEVSPDKTLRPPLKVRWKTLTSSFGNYRGVIVADGMLFAADSVGQLHALDAETGEIIWRTWDVPLCNLQRPGYGNWATTYADGKLLVLGGGGQQAKGRPGGAGLHCYDARTGESLWRQAGPVLTAGGGGSHLDGVAADKGRVFGIWYDGNGSIFTAAFDLATGKELWKREHPGIIAGDAGGVHSSQGAIGEGTWFCSISRAPRDVKPQDVKGATFAINPDNGEPRWKNTEHFVSGDSHVRYRNGILAVFSGMPRGGFVHALDPRDGRLLWSEKSRAFHGDALTDLFLESRGKKGAFDSYCGANHHANGVWYGGSSQDSCLLSAKTAGEGGPKVVWSHFSLARGCAAPAPAYGRLYFVPNGVGTAMCFENE